MIFEQPNIIFDIIFEQTNMTLDIIFEQQNLIFHIIFEQPSIIFEQPSAQILSCSQILFVILTNIIQPKLWKYEKEKLLHKCRPRV